MSFSQREFYAKYSKEHREPFNEQLFDRNVEDIIKHVTNVVKSIQREKFYTIKVNYINVIDDYRDIRNILHNLEANRRNKRIKYNRYDYIDLKESYILLLEVNYHLETGDKQADVSVYISIPRICQKYYFNLSGNMYSPMYQIVDGSTYNNSKSSNKKADPSVTFKTSMMRNITYTKKYKLTATNKEVIPCECFVSDIFSNRFTSFKYVLARFGFFGTLSFLKIHSLYISDKPIELADCYNFERGGIYVSMPKYLYDNNNVYQSVVYTIINSIPKDGSVNINELVMGTRFWEESLGAEYKTKTSEKGISVLDSFEHTLDLSIRECLKVPEDQKEDMYRVLRWITYEFLALRAKDNTDISTKRIRFGEYIAALYAEKISRNLFRISNLGGSKLPIEKLISAVCINTNYLIDRLKKCKLVPYRNLVNDSDILTVLKYTYKGVAGIGEEKSSAVPNNYRFVKASHLGRVDKDSSSNSDPGMGGTLCPYLELYDHGSLSDAMEPNNWEDVQNKMLETYKALTNRKDLFVAERDILGKDNTEDIERIDCEIKHLGRIISPFIHVTSPFERVG